MNEWKTTRNLNYIRKEVRESEWALKIPDDLSGDSESNIFDKLVEFMKLLSEQFCMKTTTF